MKNMDDAFHILLVDDEPDVLNTMANLLKAKGYAIKTASDGVDALKCFEKDVFNLVITDLIMPNMHGMELLAKLADSFKIRGYRANTKS